MSRLVLDAIFNGDFCTILGDIDYSTNPREHVTIADMEKYHAQMDT